MDICLEPGFRSNIIPKSKFPPRITSTTARFVRLTVTKLRNRDGDNFAFALAEMEVLHDDANFARHAAVTAQDSIETGPWAQANLTDGVTATIAPGATAAALSDYITCICKRGHQSSTTLSPGERLREC